MNVLLRIVVSLLVAVLAFVVVTVGVTEAFAPQIEFSVLVGLPVGVSAALTALFATAVGLWYRDQRATDAMTQSVARLRWAAVATVVDFVVVGALGVALYLLGIASVGIALLVVGLPVTLLVAALVGYVVGTAARNERAGPRSSSG